MAINVGVGSAYKNVNNVKVGVGSTWKQVQSAWVGVGGVWKKIWDYLSADAIAVDVQGFDFFNGPCSAAFQYGAAGTVWTIENGGAPVNAGTWLLVGANTDFEIRLTGTGDTLTGSTLNTWHLGNTGPGWTLSEPGGGTKSFNGTIDIRRTSDQVIVDSASVSLLAQSSL